VDCNEQNLLLLILENNFFMFYLKKLFPQFIKNFYHLAQAIIANIYFGFPSKKIKVIGITGTDGKTTTAQMIESVLMQAGKKVALASTINFKVNGVEEKNLSHFTTQSAFALQKFIKKAVESECEYLVLETSSHAIDQHRVWGVEFKTAVITNITREHLDYHGTMESYRSAKKKLFENVSKNKGTVVVNLDMERPEEYMQYANLKSFAYSISNFLPQAYPRDQFPISNKFSKSQFQIITAENIKIGILGSTYDIESASYKLNLPGSFNIENALAATCVALSEDIEPNVIKEALEKIRGVAGRMEAIENDLGINILVDFALTPNALKRLYETLLTSKKESAKIIAVFGSCGDRDRGKRPIIGKIVSEIADVVILTNDEPYHENPLQIINEIAAGIKNKKENEDLWIIEDRRLAIGKALNIAKKDDIIAITGMGNFETMVVGDKKIPWNDKAVIKEELQKMI
jgi:UDP-N-acetylmuramyl-tripeptide synthetase